MIIGKVSVPFACLCRVALTAGLLSLMACSPKEPIRLGFVGGLSGRASDLGVEGRNGAMLAVELRNKAGGVKGRQVELLVKDDQQNPDEARTVVSKLIDLKVDAIIGPMTSAMATVTAPLVNQAQIVMVSPTVTSNDLSGLDDHFFRVLAATHSFTKKSADYHYHHVGLRRMVAVFDQRNKAYTESWLKDYQTAFTAIGGKLVDSIGFASSEETNFSHLAQQLLTAKPDGILILANSVDAAMLCQHLHRMNPTIQITTSEWAATEQLIELGGRSVEGLVVAQFLDRQSTQTAYVSFRQDYVDHYGKAPGFAGLTAFDAVNVVLEGIERQAPGQTLKQTLLSQKTFSGAQTTVVFDDFGDTLRDTYLSTIKNGSFVVIR